jgi:hypothetical protein
MIKDCRGECPDIFENRRVKKAAGYYPAAFEKSG